MVGNKIELPDNVELATHVITAQAKERGLIGMLVGTKDHAPTNITAVILFISLIAMIAMFFVGAAYPDIDLRQAETILGTIVTTTTGYLFGKHT